MVTEPPVPVPVARPALNVTLPPAVVADGVLPDDMTSAALTANVPKLLPATKLTEPPPPPVAAPLCTTTAPLLPASAVPDLTEIAPLVPAKLASAVRTSTAPVVDPAPVAAPPVIVAAPPVRDADVVPADSTMLPPVPLFDVPTVTLIEPP
jgi:hypothetical protein